MCQNAAPGNTPAAPPDQDPLLANHSPADRKLPLAGSAFHRGWIARVHGDEQKWEKEWQTFLSHWPGESGR